MSNSEEEPLLSETKLEQEKPAWDRFENPPKAADTGSTAEAKWLETAVKVFKIVTVFIVFIVVLSTAVISKATLLLMTSQIRNNVTRPYCNAELDTRTQYVVSIPRVERVVWIWLLIFAYWVPELGTFIRSVRKSFFKIWETPNLMEFMSLLLTESLPTIGSAILVFVIFPELDVVKGAMLTNAICFVPASIGILSRKLKTDKITLDIILDILSIGCQATSFVIWPLIENRPVLYLIPVSVILISIGWWENYVSEDAEIQFIKKLGEIKSRFPNKKYFMYVFISLWKCVLFFVSVLIIFWIREGEVGFIFDEFVDSFNEHSINITKIVPIIGGSTDDFNDAISTGKGSEHTTSTWTPIVIWLVNIAATYICYAFGKFSCKVMIQGFGLAFPINLTVPVLLSLLIGMCGAFNRDECYFTDLFPEYLFFNTPPLYFLNDFVSQQHSWIWLIWLLSQAWITIHIWVSNPNSDKLCSTEQLFMKPMYDAFLIDQSIAMNRRRKIVKHEIHGNPHVTGDDETKIFACGTMWHETKEEMMEFLKSIMRMDRDQCAHRLVRKFLKIKRSDYYDFETHIFFDDAFVRRSQTDPDPQINQYVKDLISCIDQAASEVSEENIKVKLPTVCLTPYGGRLTWILPGKTKMIAHLKDKAKIRPKKRWSQVMYMYYLLGYKIMEENQYRDNPYEVELHAKNTYLLALDGDIDFQPNAVKLLVDYMKRNQTLGAACGRIHPIGSGAMVWYQMFEYAIGHWLQKATEHVIGCVLCSPGCFSLFRGKALMDSSVMAKYTTVPSEALHYVQYDQGEDRWLCTLLLQRGYRVEYSAASDAYTHCPEGFNEFYNQRRRWMPSTIANIFDLLSEYKKTVKINENISTLYVGYQVILMIGTVIGPGTIFLMLVGAFVAAFKMDQWSSFLWNLVPILIFVIVCATCKSDTQLFFAGLISAVYGLIMMAVFVGVMLQISEDGFLAPSSLFFFCLAGEMIIAALLHPKEFNCLKYGVIYYVTVPSMYLLLMIYSIFNMNNVSWGTREVTVVQEPKPDGDDNKDTQKQDPKAEKSNTFQVLSFFGADPNHDAGSIEFSFAGLYKCMFCTHTKNGEANEQLRQIQTVLDTITKKLDQLEQTGDVINSEPRKTSSKRVTYLEGSGALRNSKISRSSSQRQSEINLEPTLEEDDEETESVDVPANSWICDGLLSKSPSVILDTKEEKFWNGLLDRYLHPLDESKKKIQIEKELKDLRDKMVITFFMLNSLFVLVVFLLTLEKDTIHLDWPIDPKINFTYQTDTNEIRLSRTYLQLEPIGFVFVIFFALLMVVQFFAMLIHRFGTFSQIIANTNVNYFECSTDLTLEQMYDKDPVEIMKLHMSQAKEDDYKETMNEPVERRKTVYRLIEAKRHKTQVNPYMDIEEQFEKKYGEEYKKTGNNPEAIRRKTVQFINQKMQSVRPSKSFRDFNPSGDSAA